MPDSSPQIGIIGQAERSDPTSQARENDGSGDAKAQRKARKQAAKKEREGKVGGVRRVPSGNPRVGDASRVSNESIWRLAACFARSRIDGSSVRAPVRGLRGVSHHAELGSGTRVRNRSRHRCCRERAKLRRAERASRGGRFRSRLKRGEPHGREPGATPRHGREGANRRGGEKPRGRNAGRVWLTRPRRASEAHHSRETGETGKPGNWETGRLGNRKTGKPA